MDTANTKPMGNKAMKTLYLKVTVYTGILMVCWIYAIAELVKAALMVPVVLAPLVLI